jgi:hypothetical protein
MSSGIVTFIERKLNESALRRWSKRVASAPSAPLDDLRGLRGQARELRAQLERYLFDANERLALPLLGSNAMQLPLYTDWSYRPELWRGAIAQRGDAAVLAKKKIGSEATLFHDCRISELAFRQVRNVSEHDLAPFGLRLDVFRFDGSFMSLTIDVPFEICSGLSARSIVRVDCAIDLERPIEVFARLNVKHGPNHEQIVQEISMDEGEPFVEFDLAYTKLNEKRVEKVWVDFIFEDPQMNQITLRDVTVSRRPRAEL